MQINNKLLIFDSVFLLEVIINNINAPGNTGMTFYCEIPDPATYPNSTPEFGPYPTEGFFCVGDSLDCIDFSVTDADGDSFVLQLEASDEENEAANMADFQVVGNENPVKVIECENF